MSEGNAKPRVTEIIHDHLWGGEYDMVPEKVLEDACVRGTYLHECCEVWHQGALDESRIVEEWRGYFEAYKQFCADVGWIPSLFEEEVEDSQCVGHLDEVGEAQKKCRSLANQLRQKTILEIKTAVPLPVHRIQCSAYAHLYGRQHDIQDLGAWILYLQITGKYKLVVLNDMDRREHLMAFLGALQVHHWRRKYLNSAIKLEGEK